MLLPSKNDDISSVSENKLLKRSPSPAKANVHQKIDFMKIRKSKNALRIEVNDDPEEDLKTLKMVPENNDERYLKV